MQLPCICCRLTFHYFLSNSQVIVTPGCEHDLILNVLLVPSPPPPPPKEGHGGASIIHTQEMHTHRYTPAPYLLDNYMKLTIVVSHLCSGCISSSGDD